MKPFLSNVVYLGRKDKIISGVEVLFFIFSILIQRACIAFMTRKKKKSFLPERTSLALHLMVSALASRFLGPTFRHYPCPLESVALEV